MASAAAAAAAATAGNNLTSNMNDNNSVPVVSEDTPLSYDAVFPPLPAGRTGQTFPLVDSAYNKVASMPSKQSVRTLAFKVPVEERRYPTGGMTHSDEQSRAIQNATRVLAVNIEYSETKDHCLQVFIHGKQPDCLEAKKRLVEALQKQNSHTLNIPREHHRFILGKKGAKLREIEMSTSTKIEVPREQENSDLITIRGARDGIEKARHELLCISDEQSKLASERMTVEKIWHPFIIGPNGNNLAALRDRTGARINIPPPTVMKDEIVVAGEKESVMKAVAEINRIVNEKQRKCQTVAVEIAKSQHKYIIGPKGSGLSEILELVGVSVEVPPNESDSQTITLRGASESLGTALTLVYQKAKSMVMEPVECPSWLHRFVIGKKGATLQKITEGKQRLHIDFVESENKIHIEGPKEEVNEVVDQLTAIIEDLVHTMARAEVPIDPRFHKHIIGKSGSNVNRLKKDTLCYIRIPEDANDWNVVIEGPPSGVETVKEEIISMVNKIENEKSKDVIIEQKYHRLLIGPQGSRIRDLRDSFQQVQIIFPDPSKKSDIVQVRGPRVEVDPAAKMLSKMLQELKEANYTEEVRIFKKFHKNIIGKGGSNIRSIREDTQTKIDLPDSSSDSDVIRITGRKKNVQEAVSKIESIQKQMANVTEISVNIPHSLHTKLIGKKGRLIRSLEDEMGGVQIRFPPPESGSSTVTVRGPRNDVERAAKQLSDLAQQKLEQLYQESIYAKPEFHKFLIGRRGDNISKLRKLTGARIVFPEPEREGPAEENPKDHEEIQIIGTKEAVAKARSELETQIKELENIIEEEMEVDPKWHRHFIQQRGAELNNLANQFGGVSVSFPKPPVKSSKVRVKGPRKCVEGAVARINEIVEDLASRITIQVVIPHTHHKALIGKNGESVQEICTDFNVSVKFPDRPVPAPEKNVNGHAPLNGDAGASSESASDSGTGENEIAKSPIPEENIICITGKKENCERARDAFLALVPLTMEVELPNEFHRLLIGQSGQSLRDLMKKYMVSITVPDKSKKLDNIFVKGTRVHIENVKEAIIDLRKQWEDEKADREAKNFELTVEVPQKYHREIIGVRGANIKKFRDQHQVIINMPDPKSLSDTVTIRGYQENVEAAIADIKKRVSELESYVLEEVVIPSMVHSRIIGGKGLNLRKLQETFKVQINFPGRDATEENADVVIVYGPKDGVDECCNQLITDANDMLQDMQEREQISSLTQAPSSRNLEEKRRREHDQRSKGIGFIVSDAPWHQPAPDTNSTADFPSIGGATSNGNSSPALTGRWGKK